MSLIDGRGRWYRWNTKPTTGDRLRLDAGTLAKRIDLSQPGSWNWGWGENHERGWIGLEVVPEQNAIRLRYKFRDEPVPDYLVSVSSDSQPFGGRRYYFHCPVCDRRVKHLYAGQYFVCRRCADITYASKQITKGDQIPQLQKRMRAIQRRLGVNVTLVSPLPDQKPKGMHRRTYARLRVEYGHFSYLYGLMWSADLVKFVGLEDMPDVELRELRRWEDSNFYDGDGWEWAMVSEMYRYERNRRGEPPKKLTLGELASMAGVTVAFAKEAQGVGLIRPDRGRDTRTKRYRSRLANWLGKLHGLRTEGYSWDDLQAWSERRFQPGYEAERKRPKPKS